MRRLEPVLARRAAATAGRLMMATAGIILAASAPALAHPHVWVAHEAKAVFENGALTGLNYRWVFDEIYTASAIEGLDKNNDGKLDAAELDELLKVNIEGLKEFDYFTSALLAGKAVPFGDAKNFQMELVAVDEPPGPQMLVGPNATSGTQTQAPPIVFDDAAREAPRTVWGRISAWFSGLFGRDQSASAGRSGPTISGQTTTGKPAEKPKVLAMQFTLTFKQPLPAESLVAGDKGFQFQVGDQQNFIWFEPAGAGAVGLAPGAPAGCSLLQVEPHMTDEQRRLAEAFAKVGGAVAGGITKANGVVCAKP
jgi:hypothetical protein